MAFINPISVNGDKKDFSRNNNLKDISIRHNTKWQAYQLCWFHLTEICQNNQTFWYNKFELNLSSDDKRLPHMSWHPKPDRDSTRTRIIITALKCSFKTWSKALTYTLRLFFKQIKAYNGKYFLYGLRRFRRLQTISQW